MDAGVRALIDRNMWEAAFLVYGHHIGMQSITKELLRDEARFRDDRTRTHTDEQINQYLADHLQATDGLTHPMKSQQLRSSLARRMLFSCLVDADHSDTANHYSGGDNEPQSVQPAWSARLIALTDYTAGLQNTGDSERYELRKEVFAACKAAPTEPSIRTCESPVGTGKTTAVMAHLLHVAEKQRLRRIFIVLPFTSIIKQAVKVYREACVLPGEDPQSIVAEHHHQVDFESRELRNLATLWRAPIIVTTAVQFFQTLFANMPANSRKLHELPGSAVFIDEAHAAIPTWLWPAAWKQLKELAENWSCHFVLGSGSLARFWELKEFSDDKEAILDLIQPALTKRCLAFEANRVTPKTKAETLNLEELLDFVLSKGGPRLVIMNTVQSAAVVANELRVHRQSDVIHLSTALAPIDRDKIVEKVEYRLKRGADTNWTLVATSCVEAGMDFSFQTAFRERSTTASLIQVGGRVNRNGEKDGAELWDFTVADVGLNSNPMLEVPRRVLEKFFEEGAMQKSSPAALVTEAMRRELLIDDRLFQRRVESIKKAEDALDYPEMAKLCRVIDTDTCLVLVDNSIRQRLQNGQVEAREIMRNSVQIWAQKIQNLPVTAIPGKEGLYFWAAEYDSEFLGYMKGILPRLLGQSLDGFIV